MEINCFQNLKNCKQNFGINIVKDKEFNAVLDVVENLGVSSRVFAERLENFKLPKDLFTGADRKINENRVKLVFYPIDWICTKKIHHIDTGVFFDTYEGTTRINNLGIRYGFRGNGDDGECQAEIRTPLQMYAEIVKDYIDYCTKDA